MDPMGNRGIQYVASPEISIPGVRKVVVLGDPGCTRFSDGSKEVLAKILSREADLYFILGDLAFLDTEEEFREIIDFCNARVRVPVFALRGNHDLSQYARFLGRETYALVLDRTVCFFLCNATGHFAAQDLELLGQKLNEHKNKNFLILMHIPPPAPPFRWGLKKEEWEKLRAVLDPHKERVQRILCGHIHGFYEYNADGYPVTITGGGGAAMIHDARDAVQKVYHSLGLEWRQDGSIFMTFCPVSAASDERVSAKTPR